MSRQTERREIEPSDKESPIPHGWSRTELGDVAAKLVDGSHNPPAPVPFGHPMLSARNIEDDRINWDVPFRNISAPAFGAEDRRTNVSPGDVLLTIVGTIGRALAVPAEASRFAIQRSVAVVSAPDLVPRFLAYQFRGPRFAAFLRRSARGTAQKGVYLGSLVKGPLVVAPAPEQSRIVEALDSHFSRLHEAEATLERVQRNLKRYRAAVLQTAVEGRLVPTEAELARAEGRDYEPASKLLTRILAARRRRWEEAELARLRAARRVPKDDKWKATYEEPVAPTPGDLPRLPEGWCWANVDCLAEVKGGLTKNQARKSSEPLREVPYLRVANVQRGHLDLTEVATIPATAAEIAELRLLPGDVLFNEGGDRDKLGRGWVWQGQIAECIHQNHVFRARLFSSEVLPEYVSWYGNSGAQKYFFEQGKQTTNLASINVTKLKRLPVPLPPFPEQQRIVDEVQRLLSIVEETVNLGRVGLQRCQRLRQSILKWAFEGKLVDQDPNDEPAAVLLERIRAEREVQDPPPTRRGARRGARQAART